MIKKKVKTGLDLISRAWPRRLMGARIGLLVHPPSVARNFNHAITVFSELDKLQPKVLFGPQHGIMGQTQDNMVEWKGFRHPELRIPVYSLYGRTRKPTRRMLKDIDVLVIDLQDIGSRYYTFIWTMALAMEACHEAGRTVVILDRPNPINGSDLEGPILRKEFASFVGLYPLPIRHGMTIGELSLYIKELYHNSLDLHVVHLRGWKRRLWYDETGLPWVFPSPNIPTLETAAVYPGMCLLEGTNLSEGRGTTRPFEIFGAPFVNPDKVVTMLRGFKLPGVVFRPMHFLPTFQKHSGRLCGGAQIHVTDRSIIKPFKTAVAILKVVRTLYPEDFAWKLPPYEYESRLLPIDILAGSDSLRKDIEGTASMKEMEERWDAELRIFDREVRRRYLLYS